MIETRFLQGKVFGTQRSIRPASWSGNGLWPGSTGDVAADAADSSCMTPAPIASICDFAACESCRGLLEDNVDHANSCFKACCSLEQN